MPLHTLVAAALMAALTVAAGLRTIAQEAPPTVVLTGVLHDDQGIPRGYAEVQACSSTVCLYGETDAGGRFRFPLPAAAAPFVIKTPEDLSSRPRRAAALAPVHLGGRPQLEMAPVYVPSLPEGVPLGTRSGRRGLEAGDGLELTLVPGDLTPPPGKVIMTVAARRIPDDHVPGYELPGGETLVAVYAIHPFGATSRSPIAVRAASNLPAGTPVRFRTIREIDGTFSAPVAGRASGTLVATEGSAGITELTHLVITR